MGKLSTNSDIGQVKGSTGEWFITTVGGRQRFLSSTFLKIFLEQIMPYAQEEHDGNVSIGGKNITNLRFADDIDALAEEEQKLEALVSTKSAQRIRWRYVPRRPN